MSKPPAIAQLEIKSWTPEAYLELELNAEERHEYRNGEIRPMPGGTPNHNDIAGNLYILLKLALRGKAYRTFYADQRLWLPAVNLYTYPDIMVVEQPLQLQTGRTDTVMNPCLIAEVLSNSTADYDYGEKFTAYRTLPTFREYLLIDQYKIRVEHYVKTSTHQWVSSAHDNPAVTLSLKTVALNLQIADLYENIDFESAT